MPVVGPLAVYLQDQQGVVHAFLPGEEVPVWAAKQMGPHCFEGGEAVPEPASDASDPAAGPPPRSGKGSGESAWRKYAEAQGFDVSNLETRDEIVAALEEEGVAV